jgi:hypothetical protein
LSPSFLPFFCPSLCSITIVTNVLFHLPHWGTVSDRTALSGLTYCPESTISYNPGNSGLDKASPFPSVTSRLLMVSTSSLCSLNYYTKLLMGRMWSRVVLLYFLTSGMPTAPDVDSNYCSVTKDKVKCLIAV